MTQAGAVVVVVDMRCLLFCIFLFTNSSYGLEVVPVFKDILKIGSGLGLGCFFWNLVHTERFEGVPWIEVVRQYLTEQYHLVFYGKLPPVLHLHHPPSENKCVNRSKDLIELHELFTSFNGSTSESNAVFAVNLIGLPGSGKEQLARQYGLLVHKGVYGSTIISLNCESKEQFEDDLIKAICKLEAFKGEKPKRKEYIGDTIQDLMNVFQTLLRARPGWLLILDNIRDTNITEQTFYKQLPQPGSDHWGQGNMLFATQVHLMYEGEFVKLKNINRGMSPNDAKQLLCELVSRGTGGCINDKDTKRLVKKLECLPLAIVAAGIFIKLKSGITTYTFADFLSGFEEENGKAEKLYDRLNHQKGVNKYSLSTALRMSVEKHLEQDTDGVVKDLCAFLRSSGNLEIPYHVLKTYLKTKGHDEVDVLMLIHFPLVEYVAEKEVFRFTHAVKKAFYYVCPTGNLLEHQKESD